MYGDLRQECWTAILRVLPDADPARGEVGGFLAVCCRFAMTDFLLKHLRLKGTRNYPAGDERAEQASRLVLSFDALEGVDTASFLADHQPQREGEARAQIAIALARAGLTRAERAALRASLSRDLSQNEAGHLSAARRKLRAVWLAGETVDPFRDLSPSQETRQKLRATFTGRTLSAEMKEKLSRAHMGIGLGRRHSEATKEKLREAQRGQGLGRKLSDATKEKIRQQSLGRRHSEASKQKMRESKLGRKVSEETREKIRLGALRRWQEKREKAGAGEQR